MKRTVLHGTCLLNGKHPAGSQMANKARWGRLQDPRKDEKDSEGTHDGSKE